MASSTTSKNHRFELLIPTEDLWPQVKAMAAEEKTSVGAFVRAALIRHMTAIRNDQEADRKAAEEGARRRRGL